MGAKGVTHFLRHFSKTVAFSILHETLNFPCTGMNIVVQVDHGGAMGGAPAQVYPIFGLS